MHRKMDHVSAESLFIEPQSEAELAAARELIREYGRSLGAHCNVAALERELDALPGEYAAPRGRFYLAMIGGELAGCVGVRPLEVAGASDSACEMRRLYIRPAFRGRGLGRRLVQQLIENSRRSGYARLRLMTMPFMREAVALYESLGFAPIAPYHDHYDPGALFLELDL